MFRLKENLDCLIDTIIKTQTVVVIVSLIVLCPVLLIVLDQTAKSLVDFSLLISYKYLIISYTGRVANPFNKNQ